MKKKIAIGKSDFKTIIEQDFYYIDKSLLIKDVIDASDEVLLIPRPRRFGKTLNMQMLKYFFMKSGEDFSNLFEGLAVTRHSDILTHQGKYPVIYFNLKEIKGDSWDVAEELLEQAVSDAFREHIDIVDSLDDIDKKDFIAVENRNASNAVLRNSLRNLAIWLKRFHNQPVIILIDEYDTPILEAYENGYYEKMISFMRSWLGEGLKQEKQSGVLYKGIVSGIMRVAKESLFSGLNNFGVYPLQDISPFEDKFGFTPAEVNDLLSNYGLSDNEKEVANWYNGYKFGNSVIYNPWSILNYVNKQPNPPTSYWLNTSSNDQIYNIIKKSDYRLRKDLSLLLNKQVVTQQITEAAVLKDGALPKDIWSFMLAAGYLTASNPRMRLNKLQYDLTIPNMEVGTLFADTVDSWLNQVQFYANEELLYALLDHDYIAFEQHLSALVIAMLSFHDLGDNKPAEAVIQAFILGILAALTGDFQIRSNREESKGRADIVMNPFDKNQCGFIIEIKSIDNDANPEKALEDALQQIEDRQYAAGLEADGITNFGKLAIVLQGKVVKVKNA